jgi:hypothetical protein
MCESATQGQDGVFICAHRSKLDALDAAFKTGGDEICILSIMSRDTILKVRNHLNTSAKTSADGKIKILTFDPDLSLDVAQAIRCHFGEHATVTETVKQIRDAADLWRELSESFEVLEVRKYASIPTLQGIIVKEWAHMELLPFRAAKGDRPAFCAKANHEPYSLFKRAFDELWISAKPMSEGALISKAIIYSETSAELRRYRDYELSASTWFTAIQLAISGAIVSDKARLFYQGDVCWRAILAAMLAYWVSATAVFCVAFAQHRMLRLRGWFESEFPNTKPTIPANPLVVTPYHAISLVLAFLPLPAALLVLGQVPKVGPWPGVGFFIASVVMFVFSWAYPAEKPEVLWKLIRRLLLKKSRSDAG